MKIGILGTGPVGQTLAGKLAEVGEDVMIGTRDVATTMRRRSPDRFKRPGFSEWLKQNSKVQVGMFSEAAGYGEILINATDGMYSLNALKMAGNSNLEGKILVDLSNPLDSSSGWPLALGVSNTDSMGERIQRALPHARVVKTLNTVTAGVMVNPGQIANGEHSIFVSGNDAEAKAQVSRLLKEWFGWKHVIDLGDISTARGVEMYLLLWLRLMGSLGTGMFNIYVVR